ncbi:MAG: DUF3570 domain-containing protein, partial [Polyangiaceae bacterium]
MRAVPSVVAGAIVALLGLLSAATAGASGDTEGFALSRLVARTGGEVTAYSDSDSVNVFSPSLTASLYDPVSGWTVGAKYLVDVVSAASVDVLSHASPAWQETRHVAGLDAGYKSTSLFGISAFVVSSVEPDYLSLTGGGQFGLQLMNKQVHPRLGYSYGHDTAGRSDTPFDVYSLVLERHSLRGEVELVLDAASLLTITADAVFERGLQIKPYRYLPVFAPEIVDAIPNGASIASVNEVRLEGRVPERLPEHRDRFALSGRYAHRGRKKTAIISERLYADNWGVVATTTDMRLIVDASRRWFLWPRVRFHAQKGASFWARAYPATRGGNEVTLPDLRGGDRELGPL